MIILITAKCFKEFGGGWFRGKETLSFFWEEQPCKVCLFFFSNMAACNEALGQGNWGGDKGEITSLKVA